jgi:hypothetical protein
MKTFWKGFATLFFYLISGALLLYAGSRSLAFIQLTLPPDQQITGFLALGATSGGAIMWLLVFMFYAQGLGQKITSALMIGIDLLGEFALFFIDTMLESGQSGLTAKLTEGDITMVVVGLSGLIFANIVAGFAFHLTDPEHSRDMKENFVFDNLRDKAMKLIEKRGDELSAQIAPQLAEQWAADFENRFSNMNAIGLGRTRIEGTARSIPALPAPVPVETVTATNAAESAGWLSMFRAKKKKKFEATAAPVTALAVEPEQLARRKYPAPARLRRPMSDLDTRIQAAAAIEREKVNVPERDYKLPLQ